MAAFEAGSWVWIPDEEQMHVPAKVLGTFKAGEPGSVQTEDGEQVALLHGLERAANGILPVGRRELVDVHVRKGRVQKQSVEGVVHGRRGLDETL